MAIRPTTKSFFLRLLLTCTALFITLVVMGVVRESRLAERYQRATGLASVASSDYGAVDFSDPIALWKSHSLVQTATYALTSARTPVYYASASLSQANQAADVERKVIRTAQMSMIVGDPADAAERTRQLAEQTGGYAARIQVVEGEQETAAAVSMRIPAGRLEDVRRELRKLSHRVQSDTVESEEVSKRYVDQEATLRNHRASERQYLTLLRRAQTVTEILEVTHPLQKVREEIEKAEGELRHLQHQVAMAAVAVTLRTESDALPAGKIWRPAYALKRSFRTGMENLSGYAEAMIALIMNLPAILLWAATIGLLVKLGWMFLRRFWRGMTLSTSPASEVRRP